MDMLTDFLSYLSFTQRKKIYQSCVMKYTSYWFERGLSNSLKSTKLSKKNIEKYIFVGKKSTDYTDVFWISGTFVK